MSDWAGVLEVWTRTYYSAEANTQVGRTMHQNRHFKTKKIGACVDQHATGDCAMNEITEDK